MWLEEELIVVGGVETALYLVHCTDCSIGKSAAIASRAWTATGGTPSSGTATILTTTYTDLTSRSITLVVTDANGLTGTVTKAVPTESQATYLRRPLYLAGGGEWECFDGGSWHTDAPSAGSVDVTANGPLASAGALALVTADQLFSSASETTPFDAGATVTAVWMETDVSPTRMLLGSSDGRVALSTDGGVTWTVITGPSGDSIVRVTINRDNPNQWFVLTATHYYDTVDGGANWSTLQTAGVGETYYDVAHSWDRGYLIVGDDGAGNPIAIDSGGTVQTFPGGAAGLYAVTARILGGYACIDSAGATYLSGSGSPTFTAATALPAGCDVQPRGLQRDGMVPDMFYIAGGDGGCWKSVDGFGSAGGYFNIRTPGVGNANGGQVYVMIGVDGLLANPFTAVTEYSDADCKVLSLWDTAPHDDPPVDWQTPGYDDAAWDAATEQGDSAYIAGAKDIWDASVDSATEECLFRLTYTAGAGARCSASLQITADDVVVEIWHNGLYIGSKATAQSTVLMITIDPALVVTGTNVLCVWVRNADA